MVGKEEILIEETLAKIYISERTDSRLCNATEVIETAEPPVLAIRRKKDSSLVSSDETGDRIKRRMQLVSAGSSGAVLVGGQVLGRQDQRE